MQSEIRKRVKSNKGYGNVQVVINSVEPISDLSHGGSRKLEYLSIIMNLSSVKHGSWELTPLH